MRKQCPTCNRKLHRTLSYWPKSPNRKDGIAGECKECHSKRSAKYNAPRKALVRAKRLEKTYAMTLGQFASYLNNQGNKCAICQGTFEDKAGRRPCVDHDHENGMVRGILCGKCNTGLGQFKDNEANLRAAIDYLAKAFDRFIAKANKCL